MQCVFHYGCVFLPQGHAGLTQAIAEALRACLNASHAVSPAANALQQLTATLHLPVRLPLLNHTSIQVKFHLFISAYIFDLYSSLFLELECLSHLHRHHKPAW